MEMPRGSKKKRQQAIPDQKRRGVSLFSRISCDIVVVVASFLEAKDFGRLSRCDVLLRSRGSLSLTGAFSPALQAMRSLRLVPLTQRQQQCFSLILGRFASTRLASLEISATSPWADKTLTEAKYPNTLRHVDITSDAHPVPLLLCIGNSDKLQSLRLQSRFAQRPWEHWIRRVTNHDLPKSLQLPALTSLDLSVQQSKERFDLGPLILRLLEVCPALRILRLDGTRVDGETLLEGILAKRLTELRLTRVGDGLGAASPHFTQRRAESLQSMTSLQTLALWHGEFGELQDLSDFPPSLTTLECAVTAILKAESWPLPALTDLTLVCHGHGRDEIDLSTQLLGAVTILAHWCPQLQQLAFSCMPLHSECNREHKYAEWMDVLKVLDDDSKIRVFPRLRRFLVTSRTHTTSSDREFGQLKAMYSSLSRKRPGFAIDFEGGPFIASRFRA